MDIVEATKLFDFIAALMRYELDVDTGVALRSRFERDPITTMDDAGLGYDAATTLYQCAVTSEADPPQNDRRWNMEDAIDTVVLSGAWPGAVKPVKQEPTTFYSDDKWHMLLLLVADHVAGRITTSDIQADAQSIVSRYRLTQEKWLLLRDGPKAAVADALMQEFIAWQPKGNIWHTNGAEPAGCLDTDDNKVLAVAWADPHAEIRRISKTWGSKKDGTVSVNLYGQGIYETARFYLEGGGKRYPFGSVKIESGSTFRCTHASSTIDLNKVPSGVIYTVQATYGDPEHDAPDFHTHCKYYVAD